MENFYKAVHVYFAINYYIFLDISYFFGDTVLMTKVRLSDIKPKVLPTAL